MNYMLKIIGGVENNFPFLHTHTQKNWIEGKCNGTSFLPRIKMTEMSGLFCLISVVAQVDSSNCPFPASPLLLCFWFFCLFVSAFYVLHSYFLTAKHCIGVF